MEKNELRSSQNAYALAQRQYAQQNILRTASLNPDGVGTGIPQPLTPSTGPPNSPPQDTPIFTRSGFTTPEHSTPPIQQPLSTEIMQGSHKAVGNGRRQGRFRYSAGLLKNSNILTSIIIIQILWRRSILFRHLKQYPVDTIGVYFGFIHEEGKFSCFCLSYVR